MLHSENAVTNYKGINISLDNLVKSNEKIWEIIFKLKDQIPEEELDMINALRKHVNAEVSEVRRKTSSIMYGCNEQ